MQLARSVIDPVGIRKLSACALMLCAVSMSASAEDSAPVVIAGSAWVGDAPTRVAEELGLFNKRHQGGSPRIDVAHFGSGLEALQQLLEGRSRFALSAATPTALALTGQLEGQSGPARSIAVLGSVALSNQSHLLLADSAGGIGKIDDLNGKRIGVMFNTSSHYGWSHFARFHGLDESSMELVDVDVADMSSAILEGRIHAAVIWHPWDQPLREAIGERLVEFELRALYTLNWLLLTDREWADQNPQVVERVLGGYIEAIDVLHERRDEALVLQNRNPDLRLSRLREMTDSIIWRLGMNWSVLVNLGSQFEWIDSRPDLPAIETPEPRDYLMGGPLLRLDPELVTLPDYLLLPITEDQP